MLKFCTETKMKELKMKSSQHIKNLIFVLCLIVCNSYITLAQENTLVTGGIAYGTGGSASYSIGQIDYNSATGEGGSLTEGLQQPYEIMVISGVEETDVNLALSVYPNPTTDFVVLSVENSNIQNMTCQLYDLQGKIIEKQKLDNRQTSISMVDLASGIYFIKVLNKNTEVKIFKVIKN